PGRCAASADWRDARGDGCRRFAAVAGVPAADARVAGVGHLSAVVSLAIVAGAAARGRHGRARARGAPDGIDRACAVRAAPDRAGWGHSLATAVVRLRAELSFGCGRAVFPRRRSALGSERDNRVEPHLGSTGSSSPILLGAGGRLCQRGDRQAAGLHARRSGNSDLARPLGRRGRVSRRRRPAGTRASWPVHVVGERGLEAKVHPDARLPVVHRRARPLTSQWPGTRQHSAAWRPARHNFSHAGSAQHKPISRRDESMIAPAWLSERRTTPRRAVRFAMLLVLLIAVVFTSPSHAGSERTDFFLSNEFYGPKGYTYPEAGWNVQQSMANMLAFWPPVDSGMSSAITSRNGGFNLYMQGASHGQGPTGQTSSASVIATQSQAAAGICGAIGKDKSAWTLMLEWDQGGGNWVPNGRPRYNGLSRTQAYSKFAGYYLNESPPLGTYLAQPSAQRGCRLASVTDYAPNAFYAFQMGVDVGLLERGIDELGDTSTGLAFMRG